MSQGPVEEPVASTGHIAAEAATPSTGSGIRRVAPRRVSLREAFGLRSGEPEAAPEHASLSPEALLPGLLDGASRAVLGRGAAPEEQAAIVQALGHTAQSADVAALTQRVLEGVLAVGPPAPTGAGLSRDALFSAIVNATFRSLLGREAGPDAIAAWKQHTWQQFLDGTVEDFMAFFISLVMLSPEWVYRARHDQARVMRAGYLPQVGVELTGHISLGSTGYTSALFHRFNLKKWSGPFDWLAASPAIIRDIIADDFRGFLDPASWRTIPVEDRPDAGYYQCHNPGLERRHNAPCILHTADMASDVGQAYLARCVDRFRQSMRGLASKIVLQVAPEGEDPGGEFQRTAQVLEDFGRSFQFVMVSLLPGQTSAPFPEVEPAMMAGRHRLLRARLLAPIIGVEATDMLDDLVLLRAALAAPSMG